MQNLMPSNSWVTLFIADTRQKKIPKSFVTLFTRDICKIICLPIAELPFLLRAHAKKRSRTASWPFSLVTYAKSYAFQQLSDPFHCGHTPKNDPEQLRDPFHSWPMQNHMPSNSWVTLFIADTRQKTIPTSFVTLFNRDICKIANPETASWPFSLRAHAKQSYDPFRSSRPSISPKSGNEKIA